MRILQVIDHLGLGGAQSLLVGLARLAADDGHETNVVALSADHDPALVGRLRDACGTVTFVDGRALWDLRSLARLVSILRRDRPDVVHTHLAVADVLGGTAAKLVRRPAVATLHNVVADRYTHPWPRRLTAMAATRYVADRLIAVSDAVADSHLAELKVAPEKLRVIRNVPVAPFLMPAGFDRYAKRAELDVADAPLVSIVARLAETKDHATLLRAVPAIRDRHPTVLVAVVGDGPIRAALERQARELGVTDSVRFLGARGDAVEVMAASDVVCNLTHALEGLPVAVLDAMSLGLPLVSTRVAGVEEVAADEEEALLVPAGDAHAAAAAVVRLLDDRTFALALGERAQARIETTLDARTWASEIEGVYRELL